MKHENSTFTREKAKQYLGMIRQDRFYDLKDCYKNHSYAKQRAYEHCLELECIMNGGYGTICGHNTMAFTYCFMCKIDGKESIAIVTKDYERYIFIEEVI